jgi:hypothetical protein
MSMTTTVNGQQRELRRLGISDMFVVQRIINEIFAGAALRGLSFSSDHNSLNELVAFLFAGIGFADQSIIAWVKSLIKDFPEEDELYIPDLMELLHALVEHPDIKSFLESGAKLLVKISSNLVEAVPSKASTPSV